MIQILETMLSLKNKKDISVIKIMYENYLDNRPLKKGKSIANIIKKSSDSQLLKTFAFSY